MPEDTFRTLDVGPRFLASLLRRDFSANERQRFARALDLLDENERHPSLRVHKLEGAAGDLWSASASDALRITFRRLTGGRKLLIECSRHYDT